MVRVSLFAEYLSLVEDRSFVEDLSCLAFVVEIVDVALSGSGDLVLAVLEIVSLLLGFVVVLVKAGASSFVILKKSSSGQKMDDEICNHYL